MRGILQDLINKIKRLSEMVVNGVDGDEDDWVFRLYPPSQSIADVKVPKLTLPGLSPDPPSNSHSSHPKITLPSVSPDPPTNSHSKITLPGVSPDTPPTNSRSPTKHRTLRNSEEEDEDEDALDDHGDMEIDDAKFWCRAKFPNLAAATKLNEMTVVCSH